MKRLLRFALMTAAIGINLILVAFIFASVSPGIYGYFKTGNPTEGLAIANTIDDYIDSESFVLRSFMDSEHEGFDTKRWDFESYTPAFPNLILHYFPYKYFSSPAVSIAAYTLLRLFFLLLILAWFFKQMLPGKGIFAQTLSLILCSAFFIAPLLGPDGGLSAGLLFSQHTGALITAVLCLIPVFQCVHAHERKADRPFEIGSLSSVDDVIEIEKQFSSLFPSPIQMIFLVLLSALSYMSNPLFVLYFSVPALIILTLGMIGNWRKYLPASIAVLGGFIMGIIGKQHDDIPFLAAPEAALPKGAVYSDLVKLVGSSPLVTVLMLLFIFSLGYSIYISFRMIQKQRARGFAGEPSFYELYHLYSSLAIVLVLLSPLMIGGQRFSIELKDIAGIFILGIFNLGFIAGRHAHHEWKERLTYLSLLALAGVLAFVGLRWAKQNPLEAFQRIESYENKLVNTIDELKMLYPMSIGAASSEHAQTIRALSLQGTRCVSVGAGLVADFKNIHRLDYTQTTIDDTVRCEFNYVVLDGMRDTSLVRKFFGENITRVERNGFGIYLCPQFYYDDDGQPVMLNNYRFHYLYEDQAEESEVIDSTFTIE